MSKNDVLMFILTMLGQPPIFHLVLMLFQTPDSWRNPDRLWSAVRHGNQSGFQSVSSPWPFKVWDGFSAGPALLVFTIVLMAPHRSGHIPETIALYNIPCKYRGEVNLDLVIARSKTEGAVDSSPGPWFN